MSGLCPFSVIGLPHLLPGKAREAGDKQQNMQTARKKKTKTKTETRKDRINE